MMKINAAVKPSTASSPIVANVKMLSFASVYNGISSLFFRLIKAAAISNDDPICSVMYDAKLLSLHVYDLGVAMWWKGTFICKLTRILEAVKTPYENAPAPHRDDGRRI